MKREGNKLSIFKIEKIPIFSHDAPKFGFGDGKKCEKMRKKVYEKRKIQVFVLTNWRFINYYQGLLHINKIFRV